MQPKPRLTRNPTVPEAARYLEVSEADVERLIKPEYRIEVVGRSRAQGAPRLLSRADVEDERDRRERKMLMPWERIIATVGVPDDIDMAIEVAGLKPVPAANLLDAIAANGPRNPIAIAVFTQEAMDAENQELVATMQGQMEILVLGDEFEYSWLIRECRELIQARMERKQQDPLKVHW